MERKEIKSDLSVEIVDKKQRVRFKAGTELAGKVNLVAIDVDEVAGDDGSSVRIHIEFSSGPGKGRETD